MATHLAPPKPHNTTSSAGIAHRSTFQQGTLISSFVAGFHIPTLAHWHGPVMAHSLGLTGSSTHFSLHTISHSPLGNSMLTGQWSSCWHSCAHHLGAHSCCCTKPNWQLSRGHMALFIHIGTHTQSVTHHSCLSCQTPSNIMVGVTFSHSCHCNWQQLPELALTPQEPNSLPFGIISTFHASHCCSAQQPHFACWQQFVSRQWGSMQGANTHINFLSSIQVGLSTGS